MADRFLREVKRMHQLRQDINEMTPAANVLLSRITRFSKLKRMDVAKRRGPKRAKVALARKIGVILHRMWIDGTYRWAEAKPIAAQA